MAMAIWLYIIPSLEDTSSGILLALKGFSALLVLLSLLILRQVRKMGRLSY
jgi:hypothetical protein